MFRRLLKLTLSCIFALSALQTFGENEFNKITWSENVPSLPAGHGESKQAGLAGTFYGKVGKTVIVAGGANFSNKALTEGGQKIYHDDIFILTEEKIKDSDKTKLVWKLADVKLPQGMAYGASFVDGNQLFLVGGERVQADGTTSASKEITVITLEEKKADPKATKNENLATTYKITVNGGQNIPSLPFTYCKGSHVQIGDTFYIIAGKQDGKVANKVIKLEKNKIKKAGDTIQLSDLTSQEVTIDGTPTTILTFANSNWTEILSLPLPLRSNHVAIAQKGGSLTDAILYVFGGSTTLNGKTIALTDGYTYIPKKGSVKEEWRKISDIKVHGREDAVSLLGARAIKVGSTCIAFFGGYNKTTWDNWFSTYNSAKSDPVKLAAVKAKFFGQKPEAFNWNKEVLAYNTVTDEWISLGETPFAPNCGAFLVNFPSEDDKTRFVLGNGEIMPGVRTETVKVGSFKSDPSFGVVNWIVLVLYFIGMLYVGYYFMKRESGADDFMTGGGRIPWWAAGVSIFATMLSSLSFMAIPNMTYLKDWRVFTAAITIFISVPIITRIYLPFFRRLGLTSAYEYLEARFNVEVRALASFMFILYMVARIGIVLYLPSIALSAVTGIDIGVCIISIGLITIVYCALGGIEAVVWGDFIQGLVLIGGAIIALIFLTTTTEGGMGSYVDLGSVANKFKTFDWAFDLKQPTFWVILLGGLSGNIISYTSDQSVVQRYLTTKDEAGARKSLWLNGILSVPVSLVFYAIGTALYTFYKTHPTEINIALADSNQVFPHFMMTKLPIGLAGLLIAAVFSATMSTLSSNINSAATAYTTDFYERFRGTKPTDKQCLTVVRWGTIIIGVLGIFFAFWVKNSNNPEIFKTFNAMIGLLVSGLGGLFAMGIFTKRISGQAALLSYIITLGLLKYVQANGLVDGWMFSFVGLASSILIAYLLSFIFPNLKATKGLTLSSMKHIKEIE